MADLLSRLADRFRADHALPPKLRTAFSDACLADPPPRSVEKMAATAFVEAGTLRYHARKVGVVPREVLSVLRLLHALRHRPGRTWEDVARRMGVHVTTLRRTSGRLTSRTLTEVEVEGMGPLLRLLQERLPGDPCLSEPPGDD